MRWLLSGLLACCALAAGDPFVGAWKANLSKSKPDPRHPLQSAHMQFEAAGDGLRLTSTSVGRSGKPVSNTFEITPDGKERPVPGAPPGITMLAIRTGSRKLDVVHKKNGQVMNRLTFEISADGRTLTSRATSTTDKPPLDHTVVFERE